MHPTCIFKHVILAYKTLKTWGFYPKHYFVQYFIKSVAHVPVEVYHKDFTEQVHFNANFLQA